MSRLHKIRHKIRKYTESHWLVYAFQGVVGILFGWFVTFTRITNVPTLVTIAAGTMLILGLIDIFNLLNRKRRQNDWGLILALAIIEIAVAVVLFCTLNSGSVVEMIILACYTLFRGIFEILIGLRCLTDITDRFMWTVCGIAGAILGFVILNSGYFSDLTTFVKFFGTYMLVYGLTNLFYGAHSKSELDKKK